ncbi:MAG: hypothetical protein QXH24_00380 [Candidatus Bathyarchaeia archaeon]
MKPLVPSLRSFKIGGVVILAWEDSVIDDIASNTIYSFEGFAKIRSIYDWEVYRLLRG